MFAIPKLGDEDSQYDGSRVFTWLADMCGLSVDLVSIRKLKGIKRARCVLCEYMRDLDRAYVTIDE